MSKHILIAAGAAHDENADRLFSNTTSGIGRALCSCGWLSDTVGYGRERKRLHAAHVADANVETLTGLIDNLDVASLHDTLDAMDEQDANVETSALVHGPDGCGTDVNGQPCTPAYLCPACVEATLDAIEESELVAALKAVEEGMDDTADEISAMVDAAEQVSATVEWPKHVPLTSFTAMGKEGAWAIADACGAQARGVAAKGQVTLTGDTDTVAKLAELLPTVWDTANNALKAWRKTSPEYKQHNLSTKDGYRNGYLAERAYLRDYCLAVATQFGAEVTPIGGQSTGYRAGLMFPELPQVESWETGCRAVLAQVFTERHAQVAKYGMNDDLHDGSGPDTVWLSPFTPARASTIEEVLRQDYIGYELETGNPTWVHLIREEVAEAFAEADPERLAEELIQVAALCVSWVEHLAKRGAKPVPVDGEDLL